MTEQELRETVAKNLIAYRKLNKLTQLELAEKINYSDKSVSKWERGDGLPDLYVLKLIADLYDISVNDLISQKKPKKYRSSRKTAHFNSAAFYCARLACCHNCLYDNLYDAGFA